MENQEVGYTTKDQMSRFAKGMFIGSGFISPRVNGGALATVFGMCGRLVFFSVHFTKNFKEDILFSLPIGLDGVTDILLFPFSASLLLGAHEATTLWFFVGCIVKTVPVLWKETRKRGRNTSDVAITIVILVPAYLFLLHGAQLFDGQVDQGPGTWLIAGGLTGLGMTVLGLSPSSFLVYMGLHKATADGFKGVQPEVIMPIGVGGILCALGLSKIMDYIFSKAYSKLSHSILDAVFALMIMIIPTDYAGLGVAGILARPVLFIAGTVLGRWVSRLEEQYK